MSIAIDRIDHGFAVGFCRARAFRIDRRPARRLHQPFLFRSAILSAGTTIMKTASSPKCVFVAALHKGFFRARHDRDGGRLHDAKARRDESDIGQAGICLRG
jgi:hypothetical protein